MGRRFWRCSSSARVWLHVCLDLRTCLTPLFFLPFPIFLLSPHAINERGALGTAGFVSAFANFPVKYLDRDVCVFVFPLSGTRIMAVREGGALDVWK